MRRGPIASKYKPDEFWNDVTWKRPLCEFESPQHISEILKHNLDFIHEISSRDFCAILHVYFFLIWSHSESLH